jgi:hypothetical protein
MLGDPESTTRLTKIVGNRRTSASVPVTPGYVVVGTADLTIADKERSAKFRGSC